MWYRLVKETMPDGRTDYYTEQLVWWMPVWVFTYNSLYFNYDDALKFYENIKIIEPNKVVLHKCNV